MADDRGTAKATHWVRLWLDMPTDPKFRTIAKRAGRPLSEVISIFVFMLTNAGANASERGELDNWCSDDVAAGLDMEVEHVEAIFDAMDGKVRNGNKLTGWEKRQPKREDGSAARAKAWRERKRTQENALKRPDSDSDTDKNSNPPNPLAGEPDGPPSNVKPITNWGQAFVDPHTSDGVVFANGSITLLNGTRQLWLERFDGDNLALDLALESLTISPNRAHSVAVQASRQLARIVGDRRDRDRRYQNATERNRTRTTKPNGGETVSDLLRKRREGAPA